MMWIGPALVLAVAAYSARVTDVAADAETARRFAGSILVATGIVAIPPLLAAIEWLFILGRAQPSVRLRSLYATSAVTVFWQNAANHWVGLAVALRRLNRRNGLRAAAAMRLLTVDQAAEGVARVLFTAAVIALSAMPDARWTAVLYGLGGMTIAVLVLRVLVSRRLRRLVRPIRPLRATLLWVVPLAALLTGPKMPVCVALATLKKLIKGTAIYVLQTGIDCECPPATAWQAVAALDWATAVPLVPGHFGVFQASTAALYGAVGGSYEQGLLLGSLYHLAHLAATLIPGAAVSLAEIRTGRRYATEADRSAFRETGDPTNTSPIAQSPTHVAGAGKLSRLWNG
jgi:hypothetical protein